MRYRHMGLGSQEELGAEVPSEAYSRHRGESPRAHYPSPRDRAQSPTTTNGFVWTLEWAWNEDQKVQTAVRDMGYRGQSGHVEPEPVPMYESGSRLASIQAPPQTSRPSMATGREQASALVSTSATALVPTQSLISSSSSSECDENSVRGRRRRRPICKQPLSSGKIRATQPRIHRPTEDADGSVSETSSLDEPIKTKTEEVKGEDSRHMLPVAPSDGSIKESAAEALGKLSMGNHGEHEESLPDTHERGWVCMTCTLINLESVVECEACGVAQG